MARSAHALPEAHIESLQSLESGYWWYVGRVEWASELIENWKSKGAEAARYIDVGCGTGGFGCEMQKRFAFSHSALVDHDPEMLKRIPSFPGLQVLSRDFSKDFELPYKADVLTCMDVLEHIENDQKFLKTLHSYVRRGGLLVLSVPAHQALYSQWDKNLGHHRRYNKLQLHAKLRAAGFRVLKSRYQWSFCAPLGFIRKWSRNHGKMEFPKVPDSLNRFLISASRAESKISRLVPAPFGTSLMVGACPL